MVVNGNSLNQLSQLLAGLSGGQPLFSKVAFSELFLADHREAVARGCLLDGLGFLFLCELLGVDWGYADDWLLNEFSGHSCDSIEALGEQRCVAVDLGPGHWLTWRAPLSESSVMAHGRHRALRGGAAAPTR